MGGAAGSNVHLGGRPPVHVPSCTFSRLVALATDYVIIRWGTRAGNGLLGLSTWSSPSLDLSDLPVSCHHCAGHCICLLLEPPAENTEPGAMPRAAMRLLPHSPLPPSATATPECSTYVSQRVPADAITYIPLPLTPASRPRLPLSPSLQAPGTHALRLLQFPAH